MSSLSITAAQVLLVSGLTKEVTFGATITQGQAVYFDAAMGKWKLAQCDGAVAEAGADGYGIALSAGADGQRGIIALPGAKMNLGAGAAAAAGAVYAIGGTAEAINPISEIVATSKVTVLAVGTGIVGSITTDRSAEHIVGRVRRVLLDGRAEIAVIMA